MELSIQKYTMKKIYLDKTKVTTCTSVFASGYEVVWAGAVITSMPVKYKGKEYQRYADTYDIQFIFDDDIPILDFYTIPLVDIFAVDSCGGYIGTVGEPFYLEGKAPVCYIDHDKNCFLLADNSKDFLSNVEIWKEQMKPCTSIEVFASKEEAKGKYKFLDWGERENL